MALAAARSVLDAGSDVVPPPLGFAINSVEFVNHYRAIWERLKPGSFEVVAGGIEERPTDIESFVLEQGFPCRTITEVLSRDIRYSSLVSDHPYQSSEIADITPLADHHVRFLYSLGKAGWNFREWNRVYDVILCFGPYQRDALAEVTDSLLVEVGYPRFDTFFQGRFDRDDIALRYKCDPSRPTLVWLPTWSDLSSVDRYAPALSALSKEANVVLKLHPFARHHQPDAVADVASMDFAAVIDEPIDNVALYVLADTVLADYGGPMFGAVYTDRDLVLLDLPDVDDHELLGDGSADLLIRDHVTSIVEPDLEKISATVFDHRRRDEQRQVRAALRRALFAPFYGCAADVAASVLRALPSVTGMVRNGG